VEKLARVKRELLFFNSTRVCPVARRRYAEFRLRSFARASIIASLAAIGSMDPRIVSSADPSTSHVLDVFLSLSQRHRRSVEIRRNVT